MYYHYTNPANAYIIITKINLKIKIMSNNLSKGRILSFSSFSLLILFFVFVFNLLPVLASDLFIIERVSGSRSKDLSFSSEDNFITLKIKSGVNIDDSYFRFLNLIPKDKIADNFNFGDLKPASDLYYLQIESDYESDIFNQASLNINFEAEGKLKSVYFWDKSELKFVKIEATRDNRNNILSFNVPKVDDLIFGLFEEPVQTGKASWYVHPRFPLEMMAASVDFPFGSQVKVTNLANGKEVIVTIKDYGPDKSVHPDRVIDLGKEAFAVIASVGAGIIDVTVEPYIENKN